MSTLTTIDETDFETHWKDAMNQSALPIVNLSPDDPAVFPDYLLPQHILDWIREVADACFRDGLMDDRQHGILVCNIKEQSSLFSRIDQTALKDVVARLDAALADAD